MSIEGRKTNGSTGPGRLRSLGAIVVVGAGLLLGAVYAGAPADVARAVSISTAEAAGEGPAEASGGASAAWARAWRAISAAGAAAGASTSGVSPDEPSLEPERLERLEDRVTRVNAAWAGLAEYYDEEIAPLERVLYRYSRDTALVEHIAVALVREANRVEMEPRLLLAVLLVENPWLDPDIRSPVGAIGLMQVMPVHRGGWPQCGSDLEDIDSNICHGARIFAHYYRGSGGDIDRALLRYNGCVSGTNTPDCHQYPNHVFAHAGRASVLTWLRPGRSAGTR